MIFDLIEDDQSPQHLWMNSARGIFAIPVASLSAACEGTLGRVNGRLANANDGASSSKAAAASSLSRRAADGRLWFATQRGARHRPRTRSCRRRRQAGDHRGTGGRRLEHARVDAAQPALERRRARVTWTAPTFRTTPIRFRYRLEDFDTDWVDAGTRQATYTNPPPGVYRFHVKSDNGAGDWSLEETTIAVSMLPGSIRPCGSTSASALSRSG